GTAAPIRFSTALDGARKWKPAAAAVRSHAGARRRPKERPMYSEPVRRRHPRVPAGFLVKLHAAGRVLVQKARNLSMTGVLLEGAAAAPGETVVMEIPLPNEQRTIAVTGEVRRGG